MLYSCRPGLLGVVNNNLPSPDAGASRRVPELILPTLARA